MRKRFRNLLAVAALAVLGGVAWMVLRPPPDPLYQGKRLTSWLQEYADAGGLTDQTWQRDADQVVREIGTNAFPVLLNMLQVKDSELTLKVLDLAKRQRFIKLNHVPAQVRNHEAGHAFRILGSNASNAVPALIKIYRPDDSAESQSAILLSLGHIGPAARSAIPLLLQAADSHDDMVRASAVWSLGAIHSEPEIVAPAMTTLLRDPNRTIRFFAAKSLEKFGTNAQMATTNLAELLKDSDASTREAARHALKVIDPEATY
jgi:HEAT repeats